VTVTAVGSEPSGLATLIVALIEQNLARDPVRRALLRPCVTVLDAPDADVTVHVRIDPGAVRVGDGDVPHAHLRVRADAERLLAITNAPLRLGLPDPRRREGRALLRDLVMRRVRVRGILRHPVRLVRFMSLLSVADGGDG
jgi:hypothetical protein